MLDSVINDKEFAALMQKHVQELIIHFFQKEQNFGILCKIEDVHFNPSLPQDIVSEFHPLTLFYLSDYTFETAYIQDNKLIFEAGFGADNFGSVVSVPIISIMQIIINKTPVIINLSNYKENEESKKELDKNGVKNSMASFLSNPENSKFVKNKK